MSGLVRRSSSETDVTKVMKASPADSSVRSARNTLCASVKRFTRHESMALWCYAPQVPVPRLPDTGAAGGVGEGIRVRQGCVQRCSASAAGSVRDRRAYQRCRTIEAAHRSEEDSRAGLVGGDVQCGSATSIGGPERRVSQLLSVDCGQTQGCQGRPAEVPIPQGQPAVDQVHQEFEVRGNRERQAPVAEGRGCPSALVAGVAVRAVVSDSNKGRCGQVLRVVRRAGRRCATAAFGFGGWRRSGVGHVCGPIGRQDDRVATVSASCGTEVAESAEGIVSQGKRLREPSESSTEGRKGSCQVGRYPQGLGTQALHANHPRQPSGVRRGLERQRFGSNPVGEIDPRCQLGHVYTHAGGEIPAIWAYLRRGRPILSVYAHVLRMRSDRREETPACPLLDLCLWCCTRPRSERCEEHLGRRTGGQSKRLWSRGKTGTCSGAWLRSSNPPGALLALAGISGHQAGEDVKSWSLLRAVMVLPRGVPRMRSEQVGDVRAIDDVVT